MPELWLVCEGGSDSLDAIVLKPIFSTVLASQIVVEPSFGSQPGVVARFIEQHRGGYAGYVVDRDYQPSARAAASFIDGTPKFIWRRHSIENYLLPPSIIVRAFQRLRERFEQQSPGKMPSWVQQLPADMIDVSDELRECARNRAAEEACRNAIERLWEDISDSAGRIQKRFAQARPGRELSDPNVWREALDVEVTRIREAGERTTTDSNLQSDAAAARFEQSLAETTATAYLRDLEFLIDFHGRDLLQAFCQRLTSRGINISYRSLAAMLSAAAVEVYSNHRALYGTDDFLDLANGVRAVAELPPVR